VLLLISFLLSSALVGCADDSAQTANKPVVDRSGATIYTKEQPAAAPFINSTTALRAASGDKPAQGAPFTNTTSAKRKGKAPKVSYRAGEDPAYAKRCGWPIYCEQPLPGSILPAKRIVAYYGNPLSKRMGALGEFPKAEMLRRLNVEVARWQAADPEQPVQPALHLIAVVAQAEPGKSGKYRMIMNDAQINQVYGWAKEANALFFIDIQSGHEDIRTLVPRFEWILKNPDVHLGIDPEFNLVASGAKPGTRIGTYDAADVNFVSGYLAELVKKYQLPPKVFIVHRFTKNGVTNAKGIVRRPEVQMVLHMDGWGAPWLKRDSYRDYVVKEPVQFTGFKIFYRNDSKKGDPLLTPEELLKLNPKPLYIQYQ
jgi:hypothetical protein